MKLDDGPTIRLWDHDGFGLIVEYPSGVLYSNQTMGYHVTNPEVEGVYVPLKNEVKHYSSKFTSPQTELFNYFRGPKHKGWGARTGLDTADADFIDEVLERWEMSDSLKVNRERLRESHEAWVHAIILKDEGDFEVDESDALDVLNTHGLSIFSSFEPYPRAGILTWRNTD